MPDPLKGCPIAERASLHPTALLAWGTDLQRVRGEWSIARARGYRRRHVPIRSPKQLRLNAYRVLLTRGRDGTVLFVPPLPEMAETWEYLVAAGFRPLQD